MRRQGRGGGGGGKHGGDGRKQTPKRTGRGRKPNMRKKKYQQDYAGFNGLPVQGKKECAEEKKTGGGTNTTRKERDWGTEDGAIINREGSVDHC